MGTKADRAVRVLDQIAEACIAAGIAAQRPQNKDCVIADNVVIKPNAWENRICVGDYPDQKYFVIGKGGRVNLDGIIEHVRKVILKRGERKSEHEARIRQQQVDSEMYSRLAPLHKDVSRLLVCCDLGRVTIRVDRLSEKEAGRILTYLSTVLRELPQVKEVWQHKRIMVPSTVTAADDAMITLTADNGHKCSIPTREFYESWERVHPAPQTGEQ